MERRRYLQAVGSAGVILTAGCGALRGSKTLSDPTVHVDSPRRRSLRFSEDGTDVGSLGVDGSVTSGVIDIGTELWHREGTEVRSITLRVWMSSGEDGSVAPARVALVSPVEGDSSPPPVVHLYSPRREPGTVIEITNLDDLADETIAMIDLVVRPLSETATALFLDATIQLENSGFLGNDYTLDGRLKLEFPELKRRTTG